MSRLERSQLHKEKVLLVDDSWDNLELLSNILSSKGYEVEESDRGKLALEVAKTRPPDIILLDISMPEMDGFEVCQKLRSDEKTKDIPIIFVSALNETSNKTQAFQYGGNDYITKPFQIEEVIARVENQLQINRFKAQLKAQNTRLEQEIINHQKTQEKLLKLNDKLGKLATLDSLTQIPNRYSFDEFLTREWRRGTREQFLLSLIFCDVDYFKPYNDHFGHQAGDDCLKQVAQTISKAVKRPADLVARYGGEEFGIILPRTPAKNALQLAKTINSKIKKLYLPHPKSLVSDYVTLSLGVSCVIPQSNYNQKQLLASADRALYQAKKQGRDRAVLELLN